MFLAAVAVIVAQHPGEPQPLGADEIVAVDITGVGDGRYVLEISGSVATVTPLTLLTVGPVPPGPGPGPDPTLTDRAKAIRNAAVIINEPEMAQKLAFMHVQIAGLIDDGTLSGQQQIGTMLAKSQDMLMNRREAISWKPVTDLVSEHFTAMVQEGADDGDYSRYLSDESAAGLEAAAPEMQLDPMWIELIMKIIAMILELIMQPAGVTP